MKKLKSDSPIPLYYQLREIIRDKIMNEDWGYGTEIPSELKLCDEFNLCRATVKQAMDCLVNEGLIVRKKGKGSFVVYQKITENFLLEPAFSKKSGETGLNDYSTVIFSDFTETDSRMQKILGLENNETVYQIERLHYISGKPVLLDTHYINPKWAGDISKEDIKEIAVYKYIENTYEKKFTNYKIVVQAIMLDQYEKEQFDFPEVPTGMVVECLSFIGKDPVVFNRRTYRGDRCDLCLEFVAVNQKMEVINSEISIEERNGKRH